MKVFLSHAMSEHDAPIAARLRAVAAAYDIQILLPDRTRNNGPTRTTLQEISQSDAVVALVTGQTAQINSVNQELRYAAKGKKPIIALVEPPSQIRGVADNQIVTFDRGNPYGHEQQLINVLENIRQKNQGKLWSTLGWIAGIALALAALGALTTNEK
jgi:hypothetical protein